MSTNPQFTISLTFSGNGTIKATLIKPDGMSTNVILGNGIDRDLDDVMSLVKKSLHSFSLDGIY